MAVSPGDQIPLTQRDVNAENWSYNRNLSTAVSESTRAEGDDGAQDSGAHRNKAHIAVRASRNIPLIQWVTHLASVLFTVALFLLCGRNVYFADITRPSINSILNAFQFVARFHEIVMSASITMMVVHQLRYELCTSDGVPLGFLTNAYSLAQPQMLFTKEFWIAITADTGSRRKHLFGLLLVLGMVLIALGGPSSAILIIPQLGWWELKYPFSQSPTNGYSWLNSSYELQWPSNVNDSLIPSCDPAKPRMDMACPFASYVELSLWASDYLSQWALPNVTLSDQAGMLRYLTASNSSDQGQNGYAVASTGMVGLTRDIGTLWLYANREDLEMAKPDRPMIALQSLRADKPLLKPLVQVQCAMPIDITDKAQIEVEFLTDRLVEKDGKRPNFPRIYQTIDTEFFNSNAPLPATNYTDLSAEAGAQLLGVLIAVSYANARFLYPNASYGSDGVADSARGLLACTILPKWAPTTMSRDARTDNVLIVDNADPARIVENPSLMSQTQSVNLDISWALGADGLNATGDDTVSTLEYQLSFFAFADGHLDGNWTTRWPWLMSSMMSMTIADGLARLQPYVPLFVWHEEPSSPEAFAWNIVDLNIYLSQWRNFTNETISTFIEARTEDYYPVRWTVSRFGYAWGFERVTKYLAAAAILLHIVWVIVHVTLVLVRKWRCDSWNSLTKLMVLAMQSPPSQTLKGTSTSIDDRHTYADIVRVRESKDRDGRTAVLEVTNIRAIQSRHSADSYKYTGLYEQTDSKLRIGKKYS